MCICLLQNILTITTISESIQGFLSLQHGSGIVVDTKDSHSSVSVIKHHDKRQLIEGRVYLGLWFQR